MQIKANKQVTHITVLLYTGLFPYFKEVTVSEEGDFYIISYDTNGEAICDALEVHQSYAMDFPAELMAQVSVNVGTHLSMEIGDRLDSEAMRHRYDDMKSVRSYTGFENVFQTEAIALATWGSSCWEKAGLIEYEVQHGIRPMPTVAEVLAELPVYEAV